MVPLWFRKIGSSCSEPPKSAPERFVRKPPRYPCCLTRSGSTRRRNNRPQDRADATSSTADDLRVALNVEVLGVEPETTEGLRHPVATPTYEVLRDMPTASVSTSLTRSEHETLSSVD